MRGVIATCLFIFAALLSGCYSLAKNECPKTPPYEYCPAVTGMPKLPDLKRLNTSDIAYTFAGQKGVGKSHIGSLFEIEFNTDGTLANKLHSEKAFEQHYGRWEARANRICMAYAGDKLPRDCFTVLINPEKNYLLYTPENRYLLTISLNRY